MATMCHHGRLSETRTKHEEGWLIMTIDDGEYLLTVLISPLYQNPMDFLDVWISL